MANTMTTNPIDLPHQVTCSKCGLTVTLYVPVNKADGGTEYVCLACLQQERREWPMQYETKVGEPGEAK